MKTRRSTTTITLDNDRLNLCAQSCAPQFLADLHVAGRHSRARRGDETVRVAWSGRTHRVRWTRRVSNGDYCDACGTEWMTTVSAASEAQKARRAVMSDEQRAAFAERMSAGKARKAMAA